MCSTGAVRWDSQRLSESDEVGALPGLSGSAIPGLVRTISPPDFAGITFHEVRARSALNRVPGGSMPFDWTINPYRGCSHACVYCFARATHEWLELDTGLGFDREIVVKVNVVDVLRRELGRPAWSRDRVALGTNTDPYQRAEGRYRLMPGLISALAGSGTPMSILTKGALLKRDLPLVAAAARDVPTWIGVSIAILDEDLHHSLEPGAPGPRARLDLVRAVRDRGLSCRVMLAPVLPWLSDREEHLDRALAAIAAAGASGVTVLALHLKPATKSWFMAWLARERPDLVRRYEELYRAGPYAPASYRDMLTARVAPLLQRHGLAPADSEVSPLPHPPLMARGSARRPRETPDRQLRLV